MTLHLCTFFKYGLISFTLIFVSSAKICIFCSVMYSLTGAAMKMIGTQ